MNGFRRSDAESLSPNAQPHVVNRPTDRDSATDLDSENSEVEPIASRNADDSAVVAADEPLAADAPKLSRELKFLGGKLKLDPERHTCHWDGKGVTLTVTEFLILQALATRPGVVKTRDALMDAAYDDQVYVDDRTIDSHIKRLRKKFKQVDDNFDVIETLYGVGYRFKEA